MTNLRRRLRKREGPLTDHAGLVPHTQGRGSTIGVQRTKDWPTGWKTYSRDQSKVTWPSHHFAQNTDDTH
jgi:hypothetical protein